MTRSHLFTIAKVLISIALLIFILRLINPHTAWFYLSTLHPIYLLGVLGLSCLGILISVWKWQMLIGELAQPHVFIQLLRLFWIGTFFNNFLPGRTGGDIIRAYGIAAGSQNRLGAATTVVVDRALNLAALLVIALIALIWAPYTLSPNLRWVLLGSGGLLLFIGMACIFLIPRMTLTSKNRYIQILIQGMTAIGQLLHNPVHLLKVSFLSVIYQITVILSNYGVACSLGIFADPGIFFFAIPITALITMIPVSINGFGLREGAYALIFTSVGLSAEAAVSISIAATASMMALSLIGGFLYVTGPVKIQHTDVSSQVPVDVTT